MHVFTYSMGKSLLVEKKKLPWNVEKSPNHTYMQFIPVDKSVT